MTICVVNHIAQGRGIERVKKSIENTIGYGMYGTESQMVGFARVVTDQVVFWYLMDLFYF